MPSQRRFKSLCSSEFPSLTCNYYHDAGWPNADAQISAAQTAQTISYLKAISDFFLNPFRLVKLLPKSSQVCTFCSDVVGSHMVRPWGRGGLKV